MNKVSKHHYCTVECVTSELSGAVQEGESRSDRLVVNGKVIQDNTHMFCDCTRVSE
jgi:hypothetical protein